MIAEFQTIIGEVTRKILNSDFLKERISQLGYDSM